VRGLLPVSNVFHCHNSNLAEVSSLEDIPISPQYVMQIPTKTSPTGDIEPTTEEDCVIQSYKYNESTVLTNKFNPILSNSKVRTTASEVGMSISERPMMFTSLVNVGFVQSRMEKYGTTVKYPILFNGTAYDWNFVWQEIVKVTHGISHSSHPDPASISFMDMFFYLDGFRFDLTRMAKLPEMDSQKTYKENPKPCYMERLLKYLIDEPSNPPQPRYGEWMTATIQSDDIVDLKMTFRLDNVNVVVQYQNVSTFDQTRVKDLFSYIFKIINDMSDRFTMEYKGKSRVAACQRKVNDMVRKEKEYQKQSLETTLLGQFEYTDLVKVSLIDDMLQKSEGQERSASDKQALGYHAFPLL